MLILIVSLCFYIVCVYVSLLWGKRQYVHKKFYLFVGIALILVSFVLDKSKLPDYEQYVVYFDVVGDVIVLEPTFLLIAYIVRLLNHEVFWGFLIYLLLGISIKLIAIKRLSSLCVLSLAFYISSYWIYHELIQIRVGVAAGFFLLAIIPLYKRNLKHFLVYSFFAILFHYSAILILPLWFINGQLKNRVFYTLLIPICMLLYIMHIDALALLQYLPIPYVQDKIDTYSMVAQVGSDRGLITAKEYNPFITWYLLKAAIAMFLWLNIKRVQVHNEYAVLLLKIYTIGIALLWCFPSIPVAATRCSEFLSIVQIVLIPLIVYIERKHKFLYIIPILYGIFWIYWNASSFLLMS